MTSETRQVSLTSGEKRLKYRVVLFKHDPPIAIFVDKMDEKNMDPPPYESSQSRTSKIFENRLKIIVGLDYGTTNSGKLQIDVIITRLNPIIRNQLRDI